MSKHMKKEILTHAVVCPVCKLTHFTAETVNEVCLTCYEVLVKISFNTYTAKAIYEYLLIKNTAVREMKNE